MSILASIVISKVHIAETEEPVTRGRIDVDRGVSANDKHGAPSNAPHAFSRGDASV